MPREVSAEASVPTFDARESYSTTTEVPFTEMPEERAEVLEHGEMIPVPTVEQRRFSAPMTDWDPIQ